LGKDSKINAGLVEMHLGKNGLNFQLGSGGADASVKTLISAAKGLEAWKVNATLLFSKQDAAMEYASAMRTLYSMEDRNRELYDSILAGKTLVEKTDREETKTVLNEDTKIKTIFLGTQALGSGGYFLNAVFSHEAYRNGIDDGVVGQKIETASAVFGHIATSIALKNTYGEKSLNGYLLDEANVFLGSCLKGDMEGLASILGKYDSSADYWKLMPDGALVNDKSGWLTYADGTPVKNANGDQIGAAGIETGLLNILFGGTSNKAYNTFSDEQVQLAQTLMILSGMKYSGGDDGNARSRTWNDSSSGIFLNMEYAMSSVGTTIASSVFARYYDASVDYHLAQGMGRDIGEVTTKPVPSDTLDRYKGLLASKLMFYYGATSFVDLSKGYYISNEFMAEYEGHYAFYNYKHYGFDLGREGSAAGDSIFVGISGIVSDVNWNYASNGNSLQIEYGYFFESNFVGSGIYGEYLHMQDTPAFSKGKYLREITKIGLIGGTPDYVPHLHYDILTKNGNYTQTTLAMLLGKNAAASSLKSVNGVNTVYNPLLYYNNYLGKNIITKDDYYAQKNK
jgi:hypothetical protein